MHRNISYSVVVTTYNGSNFIIQQLESVRTQTKKPTEVLIFDDCSTDNTAMIVRNYIQKFNLDWIFEINEVNIGWKQNFMNGISKATQKIIFLCDQDDIWEKDKCELMVSFMSEREDCNLLMSNYRPFKSSKEAKIPFKMLFQTNDKKFVKYNLAAKRILQVYREGCSYCFRKEFFDKVKHIWYKEIPHDAFIYQLSLIYNSTYLFRYKAFKFRRHENNNSPKNIRTIEARLHGIDVIQKRFLHYKEELASLDMSEKAYVNSEIVKVIEYFEARKNYFSFPSFKNWVFMISHYHKSYPSVINMLGDFYIGIILPKIISRSIR